MNFKQLTWNKRLQIETFLKVNTPYKKIAEFLGVHVSTIYREVKRGRYEYIDGATWKAEDRYSPDISHQRYRNNLSQKGGDLKIGNDYELSEYIEKRIVEDRLSPSAVLGEIKRKNMSFKTSICVNTLYSYIGKGVFYKLSVEHLTFGKRNKPRKCLKIAARPPRGESIERRPKEIDERKTFGHWEMDLVCGHGKSALLVFLERLSRKEIIFKMNDKKSASVVRCLNVLEGKFGQSFSKVFRSITVDNGSEFSDFMRMERSRYGKKKRTKIYYCHPYSAYERGTNERLNREIRRKIPKGSDLSKYSESDIRGIENWINTYPRAVLGYATSEELFEYYLAQI